MYILYLIKDLNKNKRDNVYFLNICLSVDRISDIPAALTCSKSICKCYRMVLNTSFVLSNNTGLGRRAGTTSYYYFKIRIFQARYNNFCNITCVRVQDRACIGIRDSARTRTL